jgi:hypothetical protein
MIPEVTDIITRLFEDAISTVYGYLIQGDLKL